jgi:hypothetical protein
MQPNRSRILLFDSLSRLAIMQASAMVGCCGLFLSGGQCNGMWPHMARRPGSC